MKMILILFSQSFFISMLLGCSTQSLNNKIQTNETDLLNEESLMRYNTNRLESRDYTESDITTKAIIACHEKKITKGLALLENNMHSQKTNPFYWNALGTCYFLNNQYSKALFFYEVGIEALSSRKDSSSLLAEATLENNIGLFHLTFKRFQEAFESFKKANSIFPELFTPQFNMAQLYIEFNENDKALSLLKKMEIKNPNDIDLLYSLSLVYFRKNDLDKSYEAISKIKNDYLNRPDIVGLYAYHLMKKNRLTEAQNIIEKRTYADEYDTRNKILLNEIKQKLKAQIK